MALPCQRFLLLDSDVPFSARRRFRFGFVIGSFGAGAAVFRCFDRFSLGLVLELSWGWLPVAQLQLSALFRSQPSWPAVRVVSMAGGWPGVSVPTSGAEV